MQAHAKEMIILKEAIAIWLYCSIGSHSSFVK